MSMTSNNRMTKSSYTIYFPNVSAAFGAIAHVYLLEMLFFLCLHNTTLPFLLIPEQLHLGLIQFPISKFGATTSLLLRTLGRVKQTAQWLLVFQAGRENGAGGILSVQCTTTLLCVWRLPAQRLASSLLL